MHPAERAYRQRTPGSAALAREARDLFPSGVTHDSRFLDPHGIYVTRAAGAVKRDVDGNDYVDYFGGHGALLLGHAHPAVTGAVQAALEHGTHFAAGHETEIAWARKIVELVPSAERIRFTSSGTEATQMALRLARAFTGRDRVLRFRRHFHGWMDDMTTGYLDHFDGGATVGVPESVARNTLLADQNDDDGLERVFAEHGHEIAAVLIEPLGAATGRLPIDPGFLSLLRRLSRDHGVVLVFDEVITGFRVAPGGAQEAFGVIPDLTTLAKIVAGGLPGGAVCGREDIMQGLDFDHSRRSGREKIYHPGTFNANPVTAAAGLATLQTLQREDACRVAADYGSALRAGLNEILAARGLPWAVYGRGSIFHIWTNPDGAGVDPLSFDPLAMETDLLLANDPEQVRLLRLGLLANGVDLAPWPGGMCSIAHGATDLERTTSAFDAALNLLLSLPAQ